MDYFETSLFPGVYFEDSYVLGVDERPGEVRFLIDAVLEQTHPQYTEPGPDEQYCYREGNLVFPAVRRLRWISRTFAESIDKDGSVDYGNIDTFTIEGDTYRLSGDWGELEIVSETPKFILGHQTA